jgi:hypothetical protein
LPEAGPELLNQPPERSRRGKLWAVLGVIASAVFLLNFTMGVFEIPDNLPIVGNLDEAAAAALLFYSLRYLGLDLLRPRGRR